MARAAANVENAELPLRNGCPYGNVADIFEMDIVPHVVQIAKYSHWLAVYDAIDGDADQALHAGLREESTIGIPHAQNSRSQISLVRCQPQVLFGGELLNSVRGQWRATV